MPATAARAALQTSQFRWDLRVVAGTLTLHPRARSEDAESYCSTANGAASINSDILNLLNAEAQLMQIEVNPMPDISLDQLCPTASLVYPRLGLSRNVLIVGFTLANQPDGTQIGTLMLW